MFFVMKMLEYVRTAQDDLWTKLTQSRMKLDEAGDRLKRLSDGIGLANEETRKLAEWAAANGLGYRNATVATGRDFPDALSEAALAGSKTSVLVVADNPADATVGLLRSHRSEITRAYVLGGASAVSDDVLDAIG